MADAQPVCVSQILAGAELLRKRRQDTTTSGAFNVLVSFPFTRCSFADLRGIQTTAFTHDPNPDVCFRFVAPGQAPTEIIAVPATSSIPFAEDTNFGERDTQLIVRVVDPDTPFSVAVIVTEPLAFVVAKPPPL